MKPLWAVILTTILVIFSIYVGIYYYFWLDGLIKEEPDPRLPGLEEATKQIRKGLDNPPRIEWNIIRDGKG